MWKIFTHVEKGKHITFIEEDHVIIACHECNVLSYSASWVLRSAGVEDVDGGYRVDEFMARIFPPK